MKVEDVEVDDPKKAMGRFKSLMGTLVRLPKGEVQTKAQKREGETEAQTVAEPNSRAPEVAFVILGQPTTLLPMLGSGVRPALPGFGLLASTTDTPSRTPTPALPRGPPQRRPKIRW
jgi:hypothetical protein